tara:strand:+ start:88 stop:390 length:303 start_codon:yes stop_codon:yes gene_type:complete
MKEPTTLNEYYKYYLTLHQNKNCRRLHFLGQAVTLVYIITLMTAGLWGWLLFAPFVVYPFAWSGHFIFEKNEPAAFTNPIKAKISDFMMCRDILLGKIEF